MDNMKQKKAPFHQLIVISEGQIGHRIKNYVLGPIQGPDMHECL